MGCPKCGADTTPGMEFCPTCGGPLATADAKDEMGVAQGTSSERRGRRQVSFGKVMVFLAVLSCLVALVVVFWPRGEERVQPSYSDVVEMVNANHVESVAIIDSRTLEVTLKREQMTRTESGWSGVTYSEGMIDFLTFKARIDPGMIDSFTSLALEHGVEVSTGQSRSHHWIWIVVGAGAVLASGGLGYLIGRRRAS